MEGKGTVDEKTPDEMQVGQGKWKSCFQVQQPHSRPRLRPASSRFKSVLAGLVVIVTGGLVVWFILGRVPKREMSVADPPVKSSRPAKVRPSPSRSKPRTESAPKSTPKKAETVTNSPSAEDMWLGTKVIRRTAVTNDTQIVETIYTVDGKRHKYFHSAVKPIFDNASDQILALATADTPGGMMPPLPGVGSRFDKSFAASLTKEIIINEDDSDEVKSIKERVRMARQDLLDAMSKGMSAEEVLKEHRKMQEHNAAMRMEAVRGLREYLENGDAEGAREYCDKVNRAFENMGIMRIELPRSPEEARFERQMRNSAVQQQEGK